MSERRPRQDLDPALVKRTIHELNGLSEDAYAEALADNIVDPAPEETAAFRSPELAFRSWVATKTLIDKTNTVIRTRADESTKRLQARRENFRTRVGRERTMLKAVLDGLAIQQGRIPGTPPNANSRAMRELARRHSAELVQLRRHFEKQIAEEKRREKEERKAAARAAKRAR